MDLELKGLKAVVTGGTKGIGRAITQTLATEGAHIAFCARNADEVAQTVKDFAGLGVKVHGRVADVADGAALAAFVKEAAAALAGLDIVVANVSALAIPYEEANWQKTFDVDMMGTVRVVNAAMPWLEKSEHASIVTISSVSGRLEMLCKAVHGKYNLVAITNDSYSKEDQCILTVSGALPAERSMGVETGAFRCPQARLSQPPLSNRKRSTCLVPYSEQVSTFLEMDMKSAKSWGGTGSALAPGPRIQGAGPGAGTPNAGSGPGGDRMSLSETNP
jgi:hypothetical protein